MIQALSAGQNNSVPENVLLDFVRANEPNSSQQYFWSAIVINLTFLNLHDM